VTYNDDAFSSNILWMPNNLRLMPCCLLLPSWEDHPMMY